MSQQVAERRSGSDGQPIGNRRYSRLETCATFILRNAHSRCAAIKLTWRHDDSGQVNSKVYGAIVPIGVSCESLYLPFLHTRIQEILKQVGPDSFRSKTDISCPRPIQGRLRLYCARSALPVE